MLNHCQIGQGKDIIFLHGWGGSINSFISVAGKFTNQYRCTLIDFYGFGKSPHPNHPLNLSDYADGVLEIIRYYKMQDVVLVGHSFGGRVAIFIAANTTWVNALVLVDSAGVRPRRGVGYYYKVYSYKLLRKLGFKNIKAGSEDYRRLSGAMKDTFVRVVNQDLTPILPNITAPTMIVWGEHDKDTPIYMAKTIHKNIANSQLNILEGAGHYSYLDNYNQFIGIMKGFLNEINY